MKYRLKTKLSLSYIFIALVCILLISVFTNLYLEKNFKDYIIQNQKRKNNEIVSLIKEQYKEDGKWDTRVIENIGINALEQGMIIRVVDATGKVIWDATVHNNGMCQQMISHMANNMNSRYPNWKGGYVENTYKIDFKSAQVGTVQIGYYGPYFFNDNDLEFINEINKLLLVVGIFSFFLSLFVGAYMTKSLSNPILKVKDIAKKISKGNFDNKINEKSNIVEIYELTETINNLAETLQNQETLRKRLTADVAHELRTPLATLQSHMEAMIDGIWEMDIERLKSCHEEIIRIKRLVGDIEKLSKYESENLILNKSYFDISELIKNIIKNFEVDFYNKKIDIKFNEKKEIINADKDKISQVIINLLSNALKYTQKCGKVRVDVDADKDKIQISVIDNGIGISHEDLPYIFERFYRADKSRSRMTGGAGIGLTITKAIVEAHNGKIEVESQLNNGSKFIVILPKNNI
ncbi:Signal transduction histidine kinase [Caloramator quimbayensis]|uniref:histidine kinase n=1 Tax=Caloramator quimbayensis TaxID=1147123 RepID=A0A1T4YGR9_9CLOT|nr:HAMP domain-containing sensor histidine kinase [Caloramator quimbayensis]SKB00491.1 Signal transduction histidine kinase [Caloramator quimbayensis]